MKTDEKLAADLVWQDDGHVTDIVLTALADGEAGVIPQEAATHVDACEPCALRMGELALLSLVVGEQMVRHGATVPKEAPEVSLARPWALPIPAMAAAIALAALGALPAIWSASSRASEVVATVLGALPLLLRSGVTVARGGLDVLGPAMPVVSIMSVVLLVFAGIAIARAMPRELAWKKGGA